MAHFAQLDENNLVLRVIVVDNNKVTNELGIEDESIGIQYCKSLFDEDTFWKQTSYNSGNFAGIGYTYDENLNRFIPPSPFPSWTFNETTFIWEPPIAAPNGKCRWDEESQSWKDIDNG